MEIHLCPVLEVGTHILLVLAIDDVCHGRQQLDGFAAHREVELHTLQDEVQVLVPFFFRICLAEEILVEVIADGAAFPVVVVFGALMVVVAEYHVKQTGFARRVEVCRYIIGGESNLGAVLEGNGERLVILRVDSHVACDIVVEQTGVQVTVTVIDEQHLCVLRHLVEDVRVIHQLRVTA